MPITTITHRVNINNNLHFIVFFNTIILITSTLQTLKKLGLTSAEAKSYDFLVKRGPQRVYPLAQGIGTAPANIYQALASLLDMGGVVLLPGRPKVFRAQPPASWLPLLAAEIAESADKAATDLERRRAPAKEEVNEIRGKAKLYRLIRHSLQNADRKVILSANPEEIDHFSDLLDSAGRRGAEIVLFSEGGPLSFSPPPGWLATWTDKKSDENLWVVDDGWAMRTTGSNNTERGRQIVDPVFARALGQGLLGRMAWVTECDPESPEGRRIQRLMGADE